MATVASYSLLAPTYPGDLRLLFVFIAASVMLLIAAFCWRPSIYIPTVVVFLTLGFLIKMIAHVAFGVALIEPTGDFSGTAEAWNRAMLFATSGLVGALFATVASSYLPSKLSVKPARQGDDRLSNALFVLLCLLTTVAVLIYALNYKLAIMRIGYPPSIVLSAPVYGLIAFAVTWGALLASLSLTLWLVESGRITHTALVYVASLLGFLASLTMGSRIQFLLYVLAGAAVLIARWRDVENRRSITIAMCFAAGIFALSLALVTIERLVGFSTAIDPAPPQSVSFDAPSHSGATRKPATARSLPHCDNPERRHFRWPRLRMSQH